MNAIFARIQRPIFVKRFELLKALERCPMEQFDLNAKEKKFFILWALRRSVNTLFWLQFLLQSKN
jgi:hypothetical protein